MIDLLAMARQVARGYGHHNDDDLVGDLALGLVIASVKVDPRFSEAQTAVWLRQRARWLALRYLRQRARERARDGGEPEDGPGCEDPWRALLIKRALQDAKPKDLALLFETGPKAEQARHRVRLILETQMVNSNE